MKVELRTKTHRNKYKEHIVDSISLTLSAERDMEGGYTKGKEPPRRKERVMLEKLATALKAGFTTLRIDRAGCVSTTKEW